jgi:hypothetical protein
MIRFSPRTAYLVLRPLPRLPCSRSFEWGLALPENCVVRVYLLSLEPESRVPNIIIPYYEIHEPERLESVVTERIWIKTIALNS